LSSLSVDGLILAPSVYASVRPSRRADAIAHRRSRRVLLGETVAVEFESVETLRYQAQEMLYVERVVDPTIAAAEIAVYERLLPTVGSIAATMLIEIPDPDQVRGELARLDGLHESIRLEVGDAVCPGRDVPPPEEGPTAHTVSVHFLRFDLPPDVLTELTEGTPARLVVDHPAYEAAAPLSAELISLLLADVAAAAG
jgi:glycerol-3-phosphate dehydrogenase subunit C